MRLYSRTFLKKLDPAPEVFYSPAVASAFRAYAAPDGRLMAAPVQQPPPAKTEGGSKRAKASAAEFNLTDNEFRFWSGIDTTFSTYSACRACGVVCWGEAARVLHQQGGTCTVDLIGAYKLLQRDGLCVVCDTPSNQFRWGIPLHAKCVRSWLLGCPASVGQALRVVRSLRGGSPCV